MPTEKQRREAARRHLERQLQRREEREARRRRITLITSIVGTLVIIAAVVVAITVIGGNDNNSTASTASTSAAVSASTSPLPATTSAVPTTAPPSSSYPPATGSTATFKGVTVKGATDLHGYPVVSSKSSETPKNLEVKDLVVGKGQAASPTSTVQVQYTGVLYQNGKEFDSSWSRGAPTTFPLTQVVPGFTQGIGGNKASGIAPMKVGGRRIIIVPPSMGYGSKANGPIPANSTLVFVVDLLKVT